MNAENGMLTKFWHVHRMLMSICCLKLAGQHRQADTARVTGQQVQSQTKVKSVMLEVAKQQA